MAGDADTLEKKLAAAWQHHNAGQADAAETGYRAVLADAPELPEAHMLLGFLLCQTGRFAEALDHLERLAPGADNPQALHALADCRRHCGDISGAIEAFTTLNDAHPGRPDLQLALGECQEAAGNASEALGFYAAAFEASDRADAPLSRLVGLVRRLQPTIYSAELAALGAELLNDSRVTPASLARPLCQLLKLDPALQPLLNAEGSIDVDGVSILAGNDLLLALLQQTVLPDAQLEAMLPRLRILLGQADASTALPLALALATQAFLKEYLLPGDAEEAAGLRDALTKEDTDQEAAIALALCHGPAEEMLPETLRASLLQPNPARSAGFEKLITLCLREPAAEHRIMDELDTLGESSDAVSALVRAQYESFPYPRWRLQGDASPRPFAETLSTSLQLAPVEQLAASRLDRPELLIAGCGTGFHSVMTARQVAGAQVTAIDLSRRSLAYAQRKSREAGITNIRYAQADILALAGWDQRFDVVESVGVLHHMADPMAGWRILDSLLNPGGFMRIGLYSAHARRKITEARQEIARLGLSDDADSIRGFRAGIIGAGSGHPLWELTEATDFYSMSACRDLVFHAQEHQFTLPRISDCLAELGLTLLGFEFPTPWQHARFRERHQVMSALRDLEKWDAFERDHPTAFAGMYVFWLQKPGG